MNRCCARLVFLQSLHVLPSCRRRAIPKNLDINMMLDFVDDNVRPVLERVDGVSQVRLGGGAERQIQILVDAAKLAERGLSLGEVRDAIRARKRRRLRRRSRQRQAPLPHPHRRPLQSLDELATSSSPAAAMPITRLRDVATRRLEHAELRNLSYRTAMPTSAQPHPPDRLERHRHQGGRAARRRADQPRHPQSRRAAHDLSNDDVRYVEDSVATSARTSSSARCSRRW
jgi:hypothetical protein